MSSCAFFTSSYFSVLLAKYLSSDKHLQAVKKQDLHTKILILSQCELPYSSDSATKSSSSTFCQNV